MSCRSISGMSSVVGSPSPEASAASFAGGNKQSAFKLNRRVVVVAVKREPHKNKRCGNSRQMAIQRI